MVPLLNETILKAHNTQLKGGASEPFYCAPKKDACGHYSPAIIYFRADYIRSALHELAHWCIAGRQRRLLDDYGYWYTPDGRTTKQQAAFFQVEIKPQALESLFCQALGIRFFCSVDNLGDSQPDDTQIAAFEQAIAKQRTTWHHQGMPIRARQIISVLRQLHSKPHP